MLRMYIYNVYRIGSFHMFSQYSCIECENDMEIMWNDYIYMKSIFYSILGFLYENSLVI